MAKIYFHGYAVQEAADANPTFDTNKGPTDEFTQYLQLTPPGVIYGILKHVMILCDSANNRAFRLIYCQEPHADDERQQSAFIFDSNEELGADIVDNTLETFRVDQPFILLTEGRLYLTLYAAAGAFGDVTGRIAVWGEAEI